MILNRNRFHRRTASAIAKITQSVSKLRRHNRQKSSDIPQKTFTSLGPQESQASGSIGPVESSRNYTRIYPGGPLEGPNRRYDYGNQYRQSTSRFVDLELERQRSLMKAVPDLLAVDSSLMASEGTVQDVGWFISSMKLSSSELKRRVESLEYDNTSYRQSKDGHNDHAKLRSLHQKNSISKIIHDLESALALRNFELAVDHIHRLESILAEVSKGAVTTDVRSHDRKLATRLELEVASLKTRVIEEVRATLPSTNSPISLLKLLAVLAGPVDCVEALISIYEKRIEMSKDQLRVSSSSTTGQPGETAAALRASVDLGLIIATSISEAFACLNELYGGKSPQIQTSKKVEEAAVGLLNAWALDFVKKEAGIYCSTVYLPQTSSSGLSVTMTCAAAFIAPTVIAGRKLELPLESIVKSTTWRGCEHAFLRKIRQINEALRKAGRQDVSALVSHLSANPLDDKAGTASRDFQTRKKPSDLDRKAFFPSAAKLKNEVGTLYRAILPLNSLPTMTSFRKGVSSMLAVSNTVNARVNDKDCIILH